MIQGNVIKYGNNIDTDVIIPARYLNTSDPAELAKYCMIDLDKSFVDRVQAGDIMVAGRNFGCGSSRSMHLLPLRHQVLTCNRRNLARIFYRNSINIGLPIMPWKRPDIAEG